MLRRPPRSTLFPLHDALPIWRVHGRIDAHGIFGGRGQRGPTRVGGAAADRKSTRLNSSHLGISYAVFCLKKKILQSAPTLALTRTVRYVAHRSTASGRGVVGW